MKPFLLFILIGIRSLAAMSQPSTEEKHILEIIHKFFTVLENQDSIAFRNLHMENARFYIVAEDSGKVRTAIRDINKFHFRKSQVIRERMRENETKVRIHGRIATVWAPYDLWVNDVFSHCGVDVFTLLKAADGWKIANCSYTVEKAGCDQK